MGSLLHLPNEILLIVIVLLYNENSIQELSNLCLVNKRLLALAQPLIFRTIDLPINFDPFPRAVSTIRLTSLHQAISDNKRLGTFVHKLNLEIQEARKNPIYGREGSSQNVFGSSRIFKQISELASWIPTLQEFGITHGLVLRNSWEWELTLAVIQSLQSLQRLEISSNLRLDTFILLQSLQTLNKLKSLSINSDGALLGNSQMRWRPSPSWSMKELRQVSGLDLLDMAKILPYCSKLEDISFQFCNDSVSMIPNLLSSFSSTLHSLHLTGSSEYSNIQPRLHLKDLLFIQRLPLLKNLSISDWTIFPDSQPREFFDVLLSQSAYKLLWFYVEQIPEHKLFTKFLVPYMRDAFNYGRTYKCTVEYFCLDIFQPGATADELAEVAKDVISLQAELTSLGINHNCYTTLN
jgi:hypothetical protein